MMFMNEYDVENTLLRFARTSEETPNLLTGALTLARLVNWTNANSDGWPYWPKPCRAAKSLQEMLQAADRYEPVDVSEADLKKALSPVKAFLTREGVAHAEVLG